jgi:acetylcholinesterase
VFTFDLFHIERLTVFKFHASDLLNMYGGGELTDYLVHFVNHLDPNGGSSMNWPKYTKESPNSLTLQDGLVPVTVAQDTYRKEAMEFLTRLSLKNPY